jgi:DNA-binding XRE family transcriptional regulator
MQNFYQFGNLSHLAQALQLEHCFPTLGGWRTHAMRKRKPVTYLRSYRLRWGLSQHELASLLGWKRAEVISRIEKKQRPPTLKFVIGCCILFCTPAAELFPNIWTCVEADLMTRLWDYYEKIQGDPSRKTKKQIELLEHAIERAKERHRKPLL